jgi:hypothetical protein
MEVAMLVLTAVGVAAAIIAALPPLGFDLRIFGRPNMPLEGIPRFRARQAWVAIVIAAISLGVSVTAFYYFFRPRIVEKPVEKIVEKVVPQDCPVNQPKPAKHIAATKPAIALPPGTTINATTNAPNSAAVGINTGTVNVGPRPLEMSMNQELAIGKALIPFKGQSVAVDIDRATPQTDKFARSLISSLVAAGISVTRNDAIFVGGCMAYPGVSFMAGVKRQDLVRSIWNVFVDERIVDQADSIPGCSRSGEPDELHIFIRPN